jgi:hypothetical protein
MKAAAAVQQIGIGTARRIKAGRSDVWGLLNRCGSAAWKIQRDNNKNNTRGTTRTTVAFVVPSRRGGTLSIYLENIKGTTGRVVVEHVSVSSFPGFM